MVCSGILNRGILGSLDSLFTFALFCAVRAFPIMTEKAEQPSHHNSHSNAPASRSESAKAADNVVDWDGSNDPEMPVNWPTRKKAPIVFVVTLSRFLTCVDGAFK